MSFSLSNFSGIILTAWFFQILPLFVFSAEPSLINPNEQVLTKGVFLLATARLNGSIFDHSVILVVQHDKAGTFGVILNKPTEHPVSYTFPNINRIKKSNVFFLGGPVMHKYVFSLVKTKRRLKNTSHVFDDVFFEGMIRHTSSSIKNLQDGEKVKLFVGYSGWSPDQLEREISRGAWIVKPAVQSDVFLERQGTLWEDLMNNNSFLWAYQENIDRSQ